MAETGEDLRELFGWPEYLVFSAMLLISAAIGVFYGCVGGKQKTTGEFLMANRQMGTIPVAMSLIASFLSAITLLGTPSEMYVYGTQYWLIAPTFLAVMLSSSYLYLPVFYNLQVTSAYEYLELRFAKSVRLVGSVVFCIQMAIYMAIVVLAPCLALTQVTGINKYGCIVAIMTICIFYTTVGGMKAVMWTDTLQVVIMYGAMLTVLLKGVSDVGGNWVIWETAHKGGRLELWNFDPDPRIRHSVWGLLIGAYFTWIAIYGVNQAQVQRYLTVPRRRMAQNALWINFFGLFVMISMCCYVGLIIYAKYSHCDPIAAGLVKKPDQLLPLFVMDTLGSIPGLPGLFVAGIFSGALSTVSSGLNSMAAITLEDFVKGVCYPNLSEKTATKVSKGLALVYGLVSFGLIFVVENLGGVLQAALSIFGIIGGPLLGLFSLGMFFPWANAIGAMISTIVALVFLCWLGFGATAVKVAGQLVTPKLPIDVSGCLTNVTLSPPNEGESGGILEFYRVSYIWYSFIGFTIVIILGLLISFMTGKQDPRDLDPRLISPAINDFVISIFPKSFRRKVGWEIGMHFKEQHAHIGPGAVENFVSRDGEFYPTFNGGSTFDPKRGVDNHNFQVDDMKQKSNGDSRETRF